MFINLFEASEVSYLLVFLLRYTLVKRYESFWQISTIFYYWLDNLLLRDLVILYILM